MSTSVVHDEAFAHGEPIPGERWRAGVVLLIVADASFVAALSFTFLYLRGLNTQSSFHPGNTGVASLWWPWIVAAVMVVSFVAYRYGMRASVGRQRLVNGSLLALVGMVLALVLNLVEMNLFPFHVSDNAYSAAVWVIAAGNVFHLVLTVFLALGIVLRVRRGVILGSGDWHVRLVGIWMAWVCAASIIGALTVSVANGTVGCPLPGDQPDPGARSVLAPSCVSSR